LGKGCQEGKIRSLCAKLGLAISDQGSTNEEKNARVFLLGFQSNPYPFLAKSRFFLLPSLWEGLPIAMLEAMTLGRPLIVSDCSPTIRQILISEDSEILEDLSLPKEGLTGECGYLMPLFEKPGDPDTIAAWAQATRTLLDNPILQRKFEENAITLSQQYDITNTMHCWREMVAQMAKKDVAI
jgi:glycosyltransferase involved in cell wall biosynthesis